GKKSGLPSKLSSSPSMQNCAGLVLQGLQVAEHSAAAAVLLAAQVARQSAASASSSAICACTAAICASTAAMASASGGFAFCSVASWLVSWINCPLVSC